MWGLGAGWIYLGTPLFLWNWKKMSMKLLNICVNNVLHIMLDYTDGCLLMLKNKKL